MRWTGGAVVRKCHAATLEQASTTCNIPKYDTFTEESYRSGYWEKDVCGQEQLKEGINAFTVETEKLCKILSHLAARRSWAYHLCV